MYSEVKVVLRMCGDYVAFHEASVYAEYIFGDYFYIGAFVYDYLIEELNLDWEDEHILEKQDKKVLDNLVKEYINSFEREYCDITISNGLVELDNNGNVLTVYWGE